MHRDICSFKSVILIFFFSHLTCLDWQLKISIFKAEIHLLQVIRRNSVLISNEALTLRRIKRNQL